MGTGRGTSWAKAARRPVDIGELARLDRLRELLPPGGTPRFMIFGRAGSGVALQRAADARTDVELIDLYRLYHGE